MTAHFAKECEHSYSLIIEIKLLPPPSPGSMSGVMNSLVPFETISVGFPVLPRSTESTGDCPGDVMMSFRAILFLGYFGTDLDIVGKRSRSVSDIGGVVGSVG